MSFSCYYAYNSDLPVEHFDQGPCETPRDDLNPQCCGIGDICMSNGICAYTSLDLGGSGYYIGGCTDQTMQNSRCPTNCTSYGNSDVVYDYGSGIWKCCGTDVNGNRNCSFPTGSELLPAAPAPLNLFYVATVVATGSSIPLATQVAVLSSASTSASTTSNGGQETVTVTAAPVPAKSSTSLSPGASAGVAIAAVLAAVAIGAFVFYFFRRRRGYHHRPKQATPREYRADESAAPLTHFVPHEMQAGAVQRAELESSTKRDAR